MDDRRDPVSLSRHRRAHERRRARIARFRRIPVRIVLPNLVTLLALCMGLTAIRFAIDGMFQLAVAAIVGAAVLDGLDGRIARALAGATRFGAELDSLADFVDFGVAPALLLYYWSLRDIPSLGWFAAMVFAIACALRLARFNVAMDEADRPAWSSRFFVGMPAPAGAIVVLLPVYLNLSVFALPNSPRFAPFEIAYVLAVAFLMASRIPHFSGKGIGRIPRDLVIVVLFAVATTALLVATFPMEMLVALSLLYLALIPVAGRRRRLYAAADQAAAAPPPGVPCESELHAEPQEPQSAVHKERHLD